MKKTLWDKKRQVGMKKTLWDKKKDKWGWNRPRRGKTDQVGLKNFVGIKKWSSVAEKELSEIKKDIVGMKKTYCSGDEKGFKADTGILWQRN